MEEINVNPPFKGEGAQGFQPSAGEVNGGTSPNHFCRVMLGEGTASPAPAGVPAVPRYLSLTSLDVGDMDISRAEITELPLLRATELGVLGIHPVTPWMSGQLGEVTASRL